MQPSFSKECVNSLTSNTMPTDIHNDHTYLLAGTKRYVNSDWSDIYSADFRWNRR